MKITKSKLRQIIREELRLLNEEVGDGKLSREEAEELEALTADAVSDSLEDDDSKPDASALIEEGRAWFDKLIPLMQVADEDPAASAILEEVSEELEPYVKDKSFNYIKFSMLV